LRIKTINLMLHQIQLYLHKHTHTKYDVIIIYEDGHCLSHTQCFSSHECVRVVFIISFIKTFKGECNGEIRRSSMQKEVIVKVNCKRLFFKILI